MTEVFRTCKVTKQLCKSLVASTQERKEADSSIITGMPYVGEFLYFIALLLKEPINVDGVSQHEISVVFDVRRSEQVELHDSHNECVRHGNANTVKSTLAYNRKGNSMVCLEFCFLNCRHQEKKPRHNSHSHLL